MKIHKFSCLVIFISFVISSCSKILSKEDDNIRINKKIEISNITKIHAESLFHIELIQDNQEYILATGNQDQLDKLIIHTEGSTSFLSHDYKSLVQNNEPIHLEIHIKDITYIQINAPVNILGSELISTDKLSILVEGESELVEMGLNLNCQELSFHVKGNVSAKYQFRGECPKAKYVLNGTSNLIASDFKNQNIHITQNGIGEAFLYAEEKITANIYSSGNMYYKGNPEITIKRVKINNQSPTAKLAPL